MSVLLDLYKNVLVNKMMKEFKYSSVMEVPRLIKIVVNVGFGSANYDKKKFNKVIENISLISGQKPIITCSRKSISNFKIRRGFPVGCKVTLRRKLMWNFLEKLIFISIPRIRDFRGFSKKSFDKYANLNIGIKEQTIFPEIDYEKITYVHGLNISIITNTYVLKESFILLKEFYFPFSN